MSYSAPVGTDRETSTSMLHYLCEVCGMNATIVATPAGEDAWLDHMAIHANWTAFKVWTWTVQQLDLGELEVR